MVSIYWCCKQKSGIRKIEVNENLAESYLKMAENAIGTMNREKNYNLTFSISACYYSMYYSLYAILMKIGIKCEIHACTIEFMKQFLNKFYSQENIQLIKKAFDLRNISQYHVEKIINKKDSELIIEQAPSFVTKSKEILSQLNQNQINKIREEINLK